MTEYAAEGEVMYHTGLSKDMLGGAAYALLPGDPGRVEGLARALSPDAKFLGSHRDFTSWLAPMENGTVIIMSTGMGGPCVTFAVEELARLGVTTFIRVGTTGSIQETIHPGDVIVNYGAVRMDGASLAYAPPQYPAIADFDVTGALLDGAARMSIPVHRGISISTDSFWPGQERYDSFSGYVLRRLQGSLAEFRRLGCTNYEMENATLFTLASVMGLRAGSVCGVVAKRTESEAVAPPETYRRAEARFQIIAREGLSLLMKKDQEQK